jgi:hypothetical protein
MVVAALCIPCMTAAASTGPVAPLVLGAAVGYYSLKKKKKKKIPGKKVFPKTKSKNKSKNKSENKSKQKGGARRRKKFTIKKKSVKVDRVINKELKKNCCRCHYIKSKKSLRRVKGNWGHCSYDLTNCCKDKKTIINS